MNKLIPTDTLAKSSIGLALIHRPLGAGQSLAAQRSSAFLVKTTALKIRQSFPCFFKNQAWSSFLI